MDLEIGAIVPGHKAALIVVDLSHGFTSPDSPLGGDYSDVVAVNDELIQWFRERNLPIAFTTVVYDNQEQASVFRQRLPDLNILQRDSHWVAIDERLAPLDDDVIIEKHGPSGFFNSELHQYLQSQDVDTVMITGLTTSGCVRATAVDGLQNNYLVFIIREACGDRNKDAEKANLHDINAKYGRVISLSEFYQLF